MFVLYIGNNKLESLNKKREACKMYCLERLKTRISLTLIITVVLLCTWD